MTAAAPVLPDDPHTGDVGHLLVVDRLRGVWWRVHRDGTRTRVGTERDATTLVRTWTSWADPSDVPAWNPDLDSPRSVPPGDYVGDRYTVRFVTNPDDLDRWPDASPERTIP